MNQPGSVFNNNTTFEKNNQNTNTIVRMNNKTRKDIKNGLIELQKKTKEWRTLGNNQKLDSPYDLLRKDFAKLDNYSNKITDLKETRLNEGNNLLTLKNYLLAYHVTYTHALNLMNEYKTYLTQNNNKSELEKLANLINTTSQTFANNTQSFKDRFNKLNGLLLDSYKSFKTSFEGHTNYYNNKFKSALGILINYYIALIQNFETKVQNFNLSAANILNKLLNLVKTIENNPSNLETIQTKYQNLFNQNNTRSLKSLFNNLSKTTAEKLLNDKEIIISTRNLLSTSLQVGNKEIKLENIGVSLEELPSSMPIQGVNNNIQTVLNFYNDKLGARITEINNLLETYAKLCVQLKASIKIAKNSKKASSDLKQINRIKNQVDAIMTQYIQLKTIGNNCKNLGNNILNLKGNTPQNNRMVPHESSQEIPVSRNVENNLSSFDGGKKFRSPRNKAQFIFDYLLNKDGKDKLPHLHGTDNKSALDNNGEIKNKENLQQIYNKFIANNFKPRNLRNSVKKGVFMPKNKPGYNNNIIYGKQNSNTYNDRIKFAIANKDWLVKYLKDKLNK
jgi:hypothetical protein